MTKKFAVQIFNSPSGYSHFVILPDSVQSLEDAERYVFEGDESTEGTFRYYGTEGVDQCWVFEITNAKELDVTKAKERERKAREDYQKSLRRQEYERLKGEFE